MSKEFGSEESYRHKREKFTKLARWLPEFALKPAVEERIISVLEDHEDANSRTPIQQVPLIHVASRSESVWKFRRFIIRPDIQ